MKVTPLRSGAQTAVNVDDGKSAGGDRLARAKAVAMGQAPEQVQPQQTPGEYLKEQRRIKMKTNVTPPEIFAQPEAPAPAAPAPVEAAADPNPDNSEPAPAPSEETKPLSPQFAALAKQQRALAVREKAIQAREEALKTQAQSTTDATALQERIKADPLGVLFEQGVTYEQLTQAVLNSRESDPALKRIQTDLQSQIKGLKEALDTQTKTFKDTQTQAEESALAAMQAEADELIAADDAYQMIRETESNQDVRRLIKRVFDETGRTLSVKQALDEIENDLLEQSLKVAQIKKVQSKLGVQAQPAQQIPPAQPQPGQPARLQMRTLTNRDTVSAVPSRRERAIAAALGKKLA